MSGCFGNSEEDKWKESLSLSEFNVEDEGISDYVNCDWCQEEYLPEDSNSREPEKYCSSSCRSLHYEYSDEEETCLGKGEL